MAAASCSKGNSEDVSLDTMPNQAESAQPSNQTPRPDTRVSRASLARREARAISANITITPNDPR